MAHPAIDTDIDLDFLSRDDALVGLPHVCAMMVDKNGERIHASGVYFQNVPINPLTGLCAFDYERAASFGYFKLDFLNNSIYDGIEDEDHLDRLMDTEPNWDLLLVREFVDDLAQLGNHYGVVQTIRPRSVDDLALVLALIRPGKKHLLNLPREEMEKEIWKPNPDGYVFKRAHAIAYAVSIVVQLNRLVEKLMEDLVKESDAA